MLERKQEKKTHACTCDLSNRPRECGNILVCPRFRGPLEIKDLVCYKGKDKVLRTRIKFNYGSVADTTSSI